MAACCNHDLWKETVKRIDRITLQRALLAKLPKEHADCLRKQMKQKAAPTSPFAAAPVPPLMSPGQNLTCGDCKTRMNVVCYVCCQCGCAPASQIPVLQVVGNPFGAGDGRGTGSRKPCGTRKCPKGREIECRCGCVEKKCCDGGKAVMKIARDRMKCHHECSEKSCRSH